MRKFNVKVNGKDYYVEVEECGGKTVPVAETKPASAFKSESVKVVETGSVVVKAPMPGQILELCVSNGASVNKGDKLVVLEAMKMENEIVASSSGVVTFLVKKGDSVDTDAQLAYIK